MQKLNLERQFPDLQWQLYSIEKASSHPLLGEASWHPQRKLAHSASKRALFELLQKQIPELELHDIKEQSYFRLQHHPYLISRSHTKTMAAAAVIPESDRSEAVLSLGVDLEELSREIKPDIEKFYIHQDDLFQNPLENWCAKEAAFKAVSSYLLFHDVELSKPLTLKDFIFQGQSEQGGRFELAAIDGLKAEGLIFFQRKDGHLFSLALLDKIQQRI